MGHGAGKPCRMPSLIRPDAAEAIREPEHDNCFTFCNLANRKAAPGVAITSWRKNCLTDTAIRGSSSRRRAFRGTAGWHFGQSSSTTAKWTWLRRPSRVSYRSPGCDALFFYGPTRPSTNRERGSRPAESRPAASDLQPVRRSPGNHPQPIGGSAVDLRKRRFARAREMCHKHVVRFGYASSKG